VQDLQPQVLLANMAVCVGGFVLSTSRLVHQVSCGASTTILIATLRIASNVVGLTDSLYKWLSTVLYARRNFITVSHGSREGIPPVEATARRATELL
jgi:hypothetical protein